MSVIDEIKAPIAADLEKFEEEFRKSMKSDVALLDKITHYIVKRKGKQIRPMFVFLTAQLYGGVTKSTYHAASMIELLHTATLVHDDVVDDSSKRRGFFAINALWKNKIAVLVGDFLLAAGLDLAMENNEVTLLQMVNRAVKEMAEGELLQIEKSRFLNLDEDVYYEIIRKKTAVLIAACCATGAASAGASKEEIQRMWNFGQSVGVAFQIKDDLFDFGLGENTGKPIGIDIKEKKVTLPLLHALLNADNPTRKRMIKLVKHHSDELEARQEVIKFVLDSDGIDVADKKMRGFADKTLDELATFDNTPARESLSKLITYTVERKK